MCSGGNIQAAADSGGERVGAVSGTGDATACVCRADKQLRKWLQLAALARAQGTELVSGPDEIRDQGQAVAGRRAIAS